MHMFWLFSWLHTFNMKSASRNKQRQIGKTWCVEDLIVENAQFQVDVCRKQEIHSVTWGYMLSLVSNINTMLDNLHRLGLQFSVKPHCHIL